MDWDRFFRYGRRQRVEGEKEGSFLAELLPTWYSPGKNEGLESREAGSVSPTPLVFQGLSEWVQKEDYLQGMAVEVAFFAQKPKDFQGPLEGGLLSQMIKAMNFLPGQGVRILCEGPLLPEEVWHRVKGDLLHLKPKVLVTLGAFPTHLALGNREALSRVHGRFFPLEIGSHKGSEGKIQVLPTFHPDILHINPNMKRTAWMDLQKVLQYLGKKI